MKKILTSPLFLPIILCFFFFIAYAVLGSVRQLHFLSGYDVAVVDQGIWNYSHFRQAISTNHAYAFTPMLWDHVELIYFGIAPFYWIFDSVYTLIILQAFAICASGIAVFLLAKRYKLKTSIALSLLVSYLMFYGIQNAIWADVHSLVFGVAFAAWFLYFVEKGNAKLSWIFFFLSIFSKEDMALMTLLITSVLFVTKQDKKMLGFIGVSLAYLFAVFYIYFPYFVPGGYRFQSKSGLLSHLQLSNFYNTGDKRNVLLDSSIALGFCHFFLLYFSCQHLGILQSISLSQIAW